MTETKKRAPLTDNNIRKIILQYFYERNRNSTSAYGKKGSAVKISDVKRELRAQHDLSPREVHGNLTYLLSQGWVEEKPVEKQVQARGGTIVPSITRYYQITAAGIDKIEGPGEFTMPKFHGIKIEATGQSIVTLGDGNQINAQFSDLGKALVELRDTIIGSDAPEGQKLSLIADVDTIQSQLAKPLPNKGIIASAWEAIKGAAAIGGCAQLIGQISGLIGGIIG